MNREETRQGCFLLIKKKKCLESGKLVSRISSHQHWEQVQKEFSVICGNDITALETHPPFGGAAGPRDLAGRKYWPLIFFFQKINTADNGHNKDKGQSKTILSHRPEASPHVQDVSRTQSTSPRL